MAIIPEYFASDSEGYITLPALKKFAYEKRNQDLKTTVNRPELISDINEYASASEENKEQVLNWLDSVLKEGNRDVFVKELDLTEAQIALLMNNEFVNGKIINKVYNPASQHMNNQYAEELRLFRFEIKGEDEGRVLSFYMGKLLSVHNKEGETQSILYPVFVDVYVNQKMVVGRAKSKACMYKYMKSFVLDGAEPTKAEKQVNLGIDYVLNLLSLSTKRGSEFYDKFRNKLYIMLDKYAQTPKEIAQLMDEKNDEIERIKRYIMDNVCGIGEQYADDVESDVKNMVEKYFSISYPDKQVFTRDRDAYPLKIMATDDEESKLEQTAATQEPLQSKAIFFDNKKMLQKSQLCDGIWFKFFRKTSRYSPKTFSVRISVNKEQCCIKFTEYTVEEDIVHVLFSLINAGEDSAGI